MQTFFTVVSFAYLRHQSQLKSPSRRLLFPFFLAMS